MKLVEEYKKYKRHLAIKYATRIMDQQSETLYEATTKHREHVQAIVIDAGIDEFMKCRTPISMAIKLDREMRMYEEIPYDVLEGIKISDSQ